MKFIQFGFAVLLTSSFAQANLTTQTVKLVFPEPTSGASYEDGLQSHTFLTKATLEVDQVDATDTQAIHQTLIPVRVRLINAGIDAMADRVPDLGFENIDGKSINQLFGKYEGAEIGIGFLYGANEVRMTNSAGVAARGTHSGFVEGVRMSNKTMWMEPDYSQSTIVTTVQVDNNPISLSSVDWDSLLKDVLIIATLEKNKTQ